MYFVLDCFVQFVVICIDSEFNVIGEFEVFYCKFVDDYLFQSGVVLIIGIILQEVWVKGENEVVFVVCIYLFFIVLKICILGYNNVCFDDEVICNIFYCNFYDFYVWSWQYDNLCWDLMDVMCVCYVLCLEGINWFENDDGLLSFCFEYLIKVNGIEYSNVYDVMVDVYVIIVMVKLVKMCQLCLFDYFFIYCNKYKLMVLIDVLQMKFLVYVFGMFGVWCGNISWVVLLVWYFENCNVVIMVDLVGDILLLLELDSDILCECLYIVKIDFGDNVVVLVKLVYINKCLVLVQVNMLCLEDVD